MRYKFNPYERAVGAFILASVAGSILFGAVMGVKKSWLEEKVTFNTDIASASNLREGSSVFMAGLKIGRVEKLKLLKGNAIRLTFTVLKEYQPLVTDGTQIELFRPSILGERALNLVQGPANSPVVSSGSYIPVLPSFDVFDSMSGKKLEALLAKFDNILTNIDQTVAMGKDISYQFGEKKKIAEMMDNLATVTTELRTAMPHLTKKMPKMSESLAKAIDNLESVSTNLREIGPEGTAKTKEILSEAHIILKGLQKSWLIRGNVKEAKQEIAAEEKKKAEERLPASQE